MIARSCAKNAQLLGTDAVSKPNRCRCWRAYRKETSVDDVTIQRPAYLMVQRWASPDSWEYSSITRTPVLGLGLGSPASADSSAKEYDIVPCDFVLVKLLEGKICWVLGNGLNFCVWWWSIIFAELRHRHHCGVQCSFLTKDQNTSQSSAMCWLIRQLKSLGDHHSNEPIRGTREVICLQPPFEVSWFNRGPQTHSRHYSCHSCQT